SQKKGTTTYHISFIRNVMDALDKPNKHAFYIVMDNYRIHHYQYVVDTIKSRGYKPLFMP
ncbi:hypothetical protein BCV72DRAFT_208449, partial [Rhizopus microsporus var. microsporus]